MASSTRCLALAAVVALVAGVAAAAPWPPMPFAAPFMMGYLRPRRAPPMARPPSVGGMPGLGGPHGGPHGGPAYPPPRTLTFSGYFSGAGSPQSGDPYTFSWGPSLRSAEPDQEGPVDVAATPPAPPQEQGPDNPPAEGGVPEDGVGGSGEPGGFGSPGSPGDRAGAGGSGGPGGDGGRGGDGGFGGDGAVFQARAKPGRGKNNKPPKPSYPAAPEGPGSPPDDGGSDRGGYGTINAYFPFTFGGGWPGSGPESPRPASRRGYGAPSRPSYGGNSGNGGSGGSGGNGGNGGGSGNGGNGGSGGDGGSGGNGGGSSGGDDNGPEDGNSNSQWGRPQGGQQPGGGGGGGGYPYYPVAIANSFSTGRNAMASSTATAYGGAPPRS